MTIEIDQKTVLKIINLKTYFFLDTGTIKAVDGINLTINKGETLGIIGESGCGKSVTAHSILKLIPSPPGKIISGKIILHHNDKFTDITKLDNSDKRLRNIRGNNIGMIFQEPMTSFGPLHTIGNQIIESILIHKKVQNETEAKNIAINLLKVVGIPNPEKRILSYPHEFSGGMRQRAMIAMALA